jgi:hypothetical protein
VYAHVMTVHEQSNRLQATRNPKLIYFEKLEERSRVAIEEIELSTKNRVDNVVSHVPLQLPASASATAAGSSRWEPPHNAAAPCY